MSYLKKALCSALGIEVPPDVTIFSPEVDRQIAEKAKHICRSCHVHATVEGRIFCDSMRGHA